MTIVGFLLALCVLTPEDSAIAVQTLDAWSRLSREKLLLEPQPPPVIILADRRCVYTLRAQAGGPIRFDDKRLVAQGTEHADSIALPTGNRIPLGGVAFTSLFEGGKAYFVAALPAVWAADPKYRDDPEDWARFLPPVMLHELTHTRQLAAIAQAVAPHAKALQLTTIDDDALQRRFEPDSAFTRMIREEIVLLFEAARPIGEQQRLEFVRQALVARRARHARFFTGRDSSWAPIESIFADMEGVAQWAAFVYLRDLAEPRLAPDSALSRARNNRKWWSQEYGLGLYLALDALSPGWQRQVFPPRMTSSFELLERASQKR